MAFERYVPSVKKPKLKRDWEGRYVRLLYATETKGGSIFEEGEVMQVRRNFGGLLLERIVRCKECKRRFRTSIKKIPERDVELLPEDYKPTPDEEIPNV